MTESPRPRFDPYAIFRELQRQRVSFVLVGGLACVIRGSADPSPGVDITPSLKPENLRRLGLALEQLHARRIDGQPLDLAAAEPTREPLVELETDAGEVKLAFVPEGTNGYDDLRRRATREHLGAGIRVEVASPGDLVRMLETLDREDLERRLERMHRIVELDRGVDLGLGL